MPKIEIRNRQVGVAQIDQSYPDRFLVLLNEELTVAQLITHTVEEQIHDLLINQQLDAEQAQQILNQHYLTDSDVEQQANTGSIRLPAPKDVHIPNIDTSAEVQRALLAFENGIYKIIVDGYQAETSDEVLRLKPNSKVTFLRLTPLVGG